MYRLCESSFVIRSDERLETNSIGLVARSRAILRKFYYRLGEALSWAECGRASIFTTPICMAARLYFVLLRKLSLEILDRPYPCLKVSVVIEYQELNCQKPFSDLYKTMTGTQKIPS